MAGRGLVTQRFFRITFAFLFAFYLLFLCGYGPYGYHFYCDAGDLPLSGTDKCLVKLLKDNDYFSVLTKTIDEAGSEIVMSFFLFKTSDHGRSRPDIILDCLSRAAKRGVTVKVVLDIDNDSTSTISGNNKETAERLKKGGIDVCYDSLGTTTHTKVAVFDGRYTVLGSHNLTSSALKYNHEISIFVDSPEIAKETLGYINSLCD